MLKNLMGVSYQSLWALWDLGYRNRVFPIHRVKPKIISVGNLTWGGTGKTPLVEYLARRLFHRGKRTAILSRGYGAWRDRSQADEVRWLAERLEGVPIYAGPDRLASAHQAELDGMEILILDDGFQHRRLARQFDIVTVDATDPFGNGHLIPAGKLREPITSLKRANWIVLMKTDGVNENVLDSIKGGIQEVVPEIPMSETVYCPTVLSVIAIDPSTRHSSLRSEWLAQDDRRDGCSVLIPTQGVGMNRSIKDHRIGLVAAIANPGGFKRTVEQLGAHVSQTYFKRDHSTYSLSDLRELAEIQKRDSLFCWLTTSKDAVKIKPLFLQNSLDSFPTVLELEIELVFRQGESELWRAIESLSA